MLKARGGFTLIELILVMSIMFVLSSLAMPQLGKALDRARVIRAVGDIHAIQIEIVMYEITHGTPPASLADIDRDTWLDPWGRPYQYLRFEKKLKGGGHPAGARKDRFLVPINSTFDLYSVGKDGNSVSALTAKSSRDDVIRANDGGYLGLAEFF